MLQEQKDLLTALRQDQIQSQQRYEELTNKLEPLSLSSTETDQSTLVGCTHAQSQSSNQMVSAVALAQGSNTFKHSAQDNESDAKTGLHSSIPAERSNEATHHCNLVEALVHEIHHPRYKLSTGLRNAAQSTVYKHHYDEWSVYFEVFDDQTSQVWAGFEGLVRLTTPAS